MGLKIWSDSSPNRTTNNAAEVAGGRGVGGVGFDVLGEGAGVVLDILGGNTAACLLKLTPVIPFDWVIIGLVICSIVGVGFGTCPAYKGANLDPIESLRYE